VVETQNCVHRRCKVMVGSRNGFVALIKQVAPEVVSRAGLNKCGARLEALLRGTTQWSEQKFLSRASSHNARNRRCERARAERTTQCQGGLGACPPSLRAHSCFGENLCCDCRCRVLVALNNFRLSTPGHEVGSFVNPIVPKNFEIS